MKTYDLAVIGGGPAGMTAAVQAHRTDIDVVLIERRELGGLLNNANLVENFPAGRTGVHGSVLVDQFKAHFNRFDIDLALDEIEDLNLDDEKGFLLKGLKSSYKARSVIIATGTKPNTIDIDGINDIPKNKIYYEIVGLYPIQSGGDYAVIGSGDAAFDYSLQLARHDCRITILVRGKEVKCLPLLKRRADEKVNKINIEYDTEVKRIGEESDNGKLVITYLQDGNTNKILVDHLLIAVGRTQNDDLLRKLAMNSSTTIRTELNGKTNIPGLYLAGDIKQGIHRQTGIAVGDGMLAVMMAAEFINGAEHK